MSPPQIDGTLWLAVLISIFLLVRVLWIIGKIVRARPPHRSAKLKTPESPP